MKVCKWVLLVVIHTVVIHILLVEMWLVIMEQTICCMFLQHVKN